MTIKRQAGPQSVESTWRMGLIAFTYNFYKRFLFKLPLLVSMPIIIYFLDYPENIRYVKIIILKLHMICVNILAKIPNFKKMCPKIIDNTNICTEFWNE